MLVTSFVGCGAPRVFQVDAFAEAGLSTDDAPSPAFPEDEGDASGALDDVGTLSDEGPEAAAEVDAEIDAPAVPEVDSARVNTPDARPDVLPDVVVSGTDATLDVRDSGSDARDSGLDTRPEASSGCRASADCNDGMPDTIDGCEIVSGICRHERCDDGNPCTANLGTERGCMFPVLPDGTSCRPGPINFTCMGGVCPPCGGENQVCCEWAGSTMVCQRTARCRTIPGGFRRCITCGGPGERCCMSSDDVTIMWASQRCNTGLTCSSPPGVAGTCR